MVDLAWWGSAEAVQRFLDEYTIDSDYTTHRQMSVPANGYIPVANQGESGLMQGQVASMGAMQQIGGQAGLYQNRQVPQPQTNAIVATSSSNNPFGNPTNAGVSGSVQDNRSLAGSHVGRFWIGGWGLGFSVISLPTVLGGFSVLGRWNCWRLDCECVPGMIG